METMVKDHIENIQKDFKHEEHIESWEDRVIDYEDLKRFCFKENIKRGLKRMKVWTKRNWQNIFIVLLSISCVITSALFYSEAPSSDWVSNEPVNDYIELSNGIDTITVHSHALPDYSYIYNENGSLECVYVHFSYKFKEYEIYKVLELLDNDIATMEEWLESVQMNYRSEQ